MTSFRGYAFTTWDDFQVWLSPLADTSAVELLRFVLVEETERLVDINLGIDEEIATFLQAGNKKDAARAERRRIKDPGAQARETFLKAVRCVYEGEKKPDAAPELETVRTAATLIARVLRELANVEVYAEMLKEKE